MAVWRRERRGEERTGERMAGGRLGSVDVYR
jgi:hypothetical protein